MQMLYKGMSERSNHRDTMVLFKPRSWCVYCPMGTMTQLICKVRTGKV